MYEVSNCFVKLSPSWEVFSYGNPVSSERFLQFDDEGLVRLVKFLVVDTRSELVLPSARNIRYLTNPLQKH